jgi:hypothetical protein
MAKKPAQPAQEYEQHPVALKLMPGGMSDEEFDAFCEDVEVRGIIMPITLYEGKVLDGWHRYRAHLRTGKPFTLIEYKGTDPAGYVAACNVMRRKLSSLQKALVGAHMHLQHAISQRDICKRFSISNTVLTMVLKAIDNRCTKIIKRIETDSDYTRGMLRNELEELDIIHANYGKSAAPTDGNDAEYDDDQIEFTDKKRTDTGTSNAPNSVFALGNIVTNPIGSDHEDEELPDTGSRPSHPERRAKNTEAQNMKKRFMALDDDARKVFLQMIWQEAKPILNGLGYLGHTSPWVQPTKKRAKAK